MANDDPSPATRFKPGQSGNPGGRPKGVAALAREHTPEAIKALVAALKCKKERVSAAIALLDRGWGKPVQSHDLRHNFAASAAADADLLAIALTGSGITAATEDSAEQPESMVH